MTGRISSLQSLGAADGPGVRYLIFLQGCPLRCIYCHNPETREGEAALTLTAEELFERILRYRAYFGEAGGVTVSGGEPLLQSDFVSELFALCRSHSIHTALDTSGIGGDGNIERLLSLTDLVLCDLKFTTEERYRRFCRGSLREVQDFLALTERLDRPLWIRHVVVPSLTDSPEEIDRLVELATAVRNLRRIELLPFRKLCLSKYQALGLPFLLADTPECDADTITALSARIPPQLRQPCL